MFFDLNNGKLPLKIGPSRWYRSSQRIGGSYVGKVGAPSEACYWVSLPRQQNQEGSTPMHALSLSVRIRQSHPPSTHTPSTLSLSQNSNPTTLYVPLFISMSP